MATERMEGTAVDELAEDVAEVLIVKLKKTPSLDGGGICLYTTLCLIYIFKEFRGFTTTKPTMGRSRTRVRLGHILTCILSRRTRHRKKEESYGVPGVTRSTSFSDYQITFF
jgi:hypothetical protein